MVHKTDDWSLFGSYFVVWLKSLMTWNCLDLLKSGSDCVFRVMSLDEELNHLFCFFFEVCVVRHPGGEVSGTEKTGSCFSCRGCVKNGSQGASGIGCFVMDGCGKFSLFQGNVHVQECNCLVRDFIRELCGRIKVLHKLYEIQIWM